MMGMAESSRWSYYSHPRSFPTTLHLFIVISLLAVIVPSSVGNTPPTLKLSLALTGKDNLTLHEYTNINSFLALLEVVDPDQGPDGEVDCRTDNKYVGLKNMPPIYYKVELVYILDREEKDIINVDIICTDNGSPPLSQKVFFTIVVTDVNDNPPTFTQRTYSMSLSENSPSGSDIGTVQAFDRDQGENANFDYSLGDTNEQISTEFSIDPATGQISSLKPIDREAQGTFQLFVYATDHGNPPLIGEATVMINIMDDNDNPPTILTKNMSVNEALPSKSLVGTVIATDLDTAENAEIEYSLVGGEDGTTFPPFIVDPNGQVFSAFPLDREMKDNYVIQVTATDSGNPPLMTTASIHITVLDVNDNPPIILAPTDDDEPYNGIIVDWYGPEDKKTVYKVVAADQDLEENGQVYYAIDFINSKPFDPSDSLFDIDKDNGNIFLRRFIRNDDDAEQILSLFVYDGGNPSLNSSASLNVTFNIDFSAITETVPSPTPTFPLTSIEDDKGGNAGDKVTLYLPLFLLNAFLSLFCMSHCKSIFA